MTTVSAGTSKTVTYQYNGVGLVSRMTTPENGNFDYTYNGRNQPDTITDPASVEVSFDYDNGGRRTRITRPASYIDYGYNARNWITSVHNRLTNGTTLYDADYYFSDGALWDHTGNPLKRVENYGGADYTTTLRYDSVYRETEETKRDDQSNVLSSLLYGYDEVGNRISETRDGQELTFTYDDNNKLTYVEAESPTASATMQYDNAGNMTSVTGDLYQNNTIVFNDENKPTSITYGGVTDLYTYNWEGQRTRTRLDGVYRRHLYNGQRVLQDLTDGGDWHTTYTTEDGSYEGMLLAINRYDLGNERFPMYDNIGTAVGLVCELGTVTDSYALDTFGSPSGPAQGSTPNPYRYGAAWGYMTDPSGLLQLGARFYWPEVGRFVSQDPARDEVNWYAYAGSRPTVSVDPDGTIPGVAIFGGIALPAGGCAVHSYRVAHRILLTGDDKLAHCTGVCAGARCMGLAWGVMGGIIGGPWGAIGGAAAGIAATHAGWWGKERWDERIAPRDAGDYRANRIGIGCAVSFWRWSCKKCCKERLKP